MNELVNGALRQDLDIGLFVGQILKNKYGLTLHIVSIVKRGVVGTLGGDIHQSLHEWDELYRDWRIPVPRPVSEAKEKRG